MEQIKKYLMDFKLNIKTLFKEFFKKETNKKQRANMWTFSRLLISPIIPILTIISVLTNSIFLGGVALVSTVFGAVTDFFDGRSARKHNSTSEFGKNLDVVADKTFATSLGISLALLNPLFLLNIFGELAIGLTNIAYIIKNPAIDIKSSKIGKIKQWPLSLTLILGIISLLIPSISLVTNIALVNTFILQIATLANYVKSNNKQINDIELERIATEVVETENSKSNILNNERAVVKTSTATRRKEELIELRNELTKMFSDNRLDETHKVKKRTKK